VRERCLSLINRLQVVFDGARREHARQYYPPSAMSVSSLRDSIATPDGKRRHVRKLFATIADRYDFITVALSYGRDRRWKRRLIDLAAPEAGERALDLATGTGDLAFALASRGANVTGLDVTHRMIELAREKGRSAEASAGRRTEERDGFSRASGAARFLVGDMVALP